MNSALSRSKRMPMYLFVVFAAAIQFFGLRNVALAATFTPKELNFTLTISDDYLSLPASGDTLYTFTNSTPASGPPDATIAIQRLHGTIGTDHIDLNAVGL